MIRHYLTSALKNFRRRPAGAAIKLLALALGLTCLLTAHVIGDYFGQADRDWAQADRTYVVSQETRRPGGGWDWYFQTSSPPVAKYLRADFPELETVARISLASVAVRVEGDDASWQAMGADPQILDVFDLDVIAGEAALDRPDAILINDEVAREAFGGVQAAIGRTMTLDTGAGLQVTGVYRTVPPPSHLSAAGGIEVRALTGMSASDSVFAGPGGQRRSEMDNFQDILFTTYAVLPEDGSLSAAAFDRRLEDFAARRAPPGPLEMRFLATAMPETMRIRFNQGFGGALGFSGIPALYLLGALTLAVGCVNFANLAAAEAVGRAREIGLRKTLGATRRQVALQMLVESGLLALAALILVLPLSFMLALALAAQFNHDLTLPGAGRLDYWAGVAAIAAVVTVVAGAYPAAILARMRPAFAIRMGRSRGGASLVRTALISAQFAAAGFLLVMVIVMVAQSAGLRSAILDPDRNPVVTVNVPAQIFDIGMEPGPEAAQVLGDRLEALRQRVLASPAISEMAFGAAQQLFAMRAGMAAEYAQSLEPGAPRVPGQARPAYYDYFDTLEVPLLAGRTFSRDRNDFRSVVIDAATARLMGMTPQEAIGQPLYRVADRTMAAQDGGQGPVELTIIGVVEREPLELRALGPSNYLYTLQPMVNGVFVKLSGNEVEAALDHIRAVWGEAFPGEPVSFVFLDDAFDAAQRNLTMVSGMFVVLSAIAVAIAAMGLFGLASFVVQRRVREIGVRKTLGASTGRVMRLLLWDFSKPVVVANLIAWPFAFIAAQIYLNLFVTRIALTPLPFLAALVFTLLVAWLAVGGQAWRAASVKPANVLKYE